MKKLVLSVVLAAFVFNIANAQELVTKKGFQILPEQGDFVIGFDAVPVIDFALNAVNVMNNTGQTAQHPGFVSGFSNIIVGKYFLEDNIAIRARFGFEGGNNSFTDYFDNPKDVYNYPTEPDKWGEVKDVTTMSGKDIFLGGGLEFRRGHNRLQGFYGGEVLIGLASNSTKTKYGVEMDKEAADNFYTNADGSLVSSGRVLKARSGNAITLGLRGFAGVEYFVAPKISLAGEFGWALGVVTSPRGSVKTETWDGTNFKAEVETTKGPAKGSSIGFQIDDGISSALGGSAALSILFHF